MNTRLVSRVGLVLLGVPGLITAVWILAAPRSFYDDFPGVGNAWVSPDGPFNEHLLRDYGAGTLGLVVLTACALVWLSRPLVVATGLAWLAASLPHLAYHVLNLQPYESGDKVAIVVSLSLVPVLAAVVVVAGSQLGHESDADGSAIIGASASASSSSSRT